MGGGPTRCSSLCQRPVRSGSTPWRLAGCASPCMAAGALPFGRRRCGFRQHTVHSSGSASYSMVWCDAPSALAPALAVWASLTRTVCRHWYAPGGDDPCLRRRGRLKEGLVGSGVSRRRQLTFRPLCEPMAELVALAHTARMDKETLTRPHARVRTRPASFRISS